jgi:hypothetical protein
MYPAMIAYIPSAGINIIILAETPLFGYRESFFKRLTIVGEVSRAQLGQRCF